MKRLANGKTVRWWARRKKGTPARMRKRAASPSSFSLRARWVLPVDGAPIHGGCVTIAGGRLAAIGSLPENAGPMHDLGDIVLMPGLVNAHTHLEFSQLAVPLGAARMSLAAWIRLVIGDRKRVGRNAAAAIAAGIAESIAAGVTAIGEIATAPADDYRWADDGPAIVLFQEAIGFSAGRVESVFAEVERRLEAVRGMHGGLSPHAVYTVHPRLLARIVELAVARQAPVAMHLAESPEELALLASGSGAFRDLLQERSMWDPAAIPDGSRPLDYLHILARAPRAAVIHGNYLANDEIEFIGQRRDTMSVVYCPRTHDYFGHAPYPLSAMLAAGVRMALGTDSRASNPDLNLLNDLRFAAARYPAIDPATLLRMATLDGATALGLGAETGSITPGKRADLVALPCDPTATDPHEALLAVGEPSAVWIAGRQVLET